MVDGSVGAGSMDDEEEEEDKIEVQEGESLEDIKAKLKPKKSSISLTCWIQLILMMIK